jgi:hypothetical protein
MAQFADIPPNKKSKFARMFFEWITANGANNPNRTKSLARGPVALFMLEASSKARRAPNSINTPPTGTPDLIVLRKRNFRLISNSNNEKKKSRSDNWMVKGRTCSKVTRARPI